MPERSFFFKGYQFPLCARCTGLFVGYFLGITVGIFIPFPLLIGILLCIPMVLDGTTQYLKWRTSTQKLRLYTGIAGGIGIMILEIHVVRIIGGYIL